jgi:hypothetical protein
MNEAAQQVATLPDELRELADAACNGTLSVAQRDRLEEIMRRDKSSRLAYLAYLDIHAQLTWEGRSGAIAEDGAATDLAAVLALGACASPRSRPANRKRVWQRRRLWWGGMTAVAAVVLLLAAAGLWRAWQPGPEAASEREYAGRRGRSDDARLQDRRRDEDTPLP